jgi:tRNA/tmRNA/rRNA uracil-C5-methylase (TrmA/RlmC/RlmD family)
VGAQVGERPLLRLDVGPVAHGGHCVARHEGRVVFVRHALPGEVVLARVTEGGEGRRYWRADAVEVLAASPDRVSRPCPVAGPGGCGGCDWQHATPAAQRRLKAAVVVEQLSRLAGVEPPGPGEFAVEPVPGDDGGLGWRTRVRFSVDGQGGLGFRRHRSHEVVPTPEGCPIAHHRVNELGLPRRPWRRLAAVEVVAPAAGADRLLIVEPDAAARVGAADLPPVDGPTSVARREADGLHRISGRSWVEEAVLVGGRRHAFRVTGSGFWQGHPGAAQVLLDAVLAAAGPGPGECALDLYSGVGLLSAGLAARVGPAGLVIAVESDRRAAADARRNLHDTPQVRIEPGRVERVLPRLPDLLGRRPVDVVVLDPPRSGAGRAVMERILDQRPRAVVYVACDPAALARDVAVAAGSGYRLTALRAFDPFPMTHHVECVATLQP